MRRGLESRVGGEINIDIVKRYPSTSNKQSMANKAVWTGRELDEEIALAQRTCEGGFLFSINQSINKYQLPKAHGQLYLQALCTSV